MYGTIVAQARMVSFCRDYADPDTLNGRFDRIVLHLVLFVERLNADPALRGIGRAIFDRFCHDRDDNLREMGVGETAEGDTAHRESFYGRAQFYWAALAADGGTLEGALARNIYGGLTPPGA